jgi:hypothetical protein
MYVALFNTGSRAGVLPVDFALLGIRGKAAVRDLWEKKDMGIFKKRYQQSLNSHSAVLLRLSVQ